MDISYKKVTSTEELLQILALQQQNLPLVLSDDEKLKEGFVTVTHTMELLERMNAKEAHIIAKQGETVVGYALSMHPDFAKEIEVLKPMFTIITNQITSATSYLIMGQICIAKKYRSQGVFRNLYATMLKEFGEKYDMLITEVAAHNQRSLQAHYAIGFNDLVIYKSEDVTWHLIYLEKKTVN
ncbi:GNAT family N-acetyltransferase [Aquimarina brevivitae]|uniref:Acetyltransferase (GNAT) family protein n=1 Tax=Aquimarina brevivitae TaxID=323412 RepID=A0A4Q7PGD7_9FLAO|nr:GNAT family N-acetyltransferase [Aquimarina brevivitae]RZS99566.1 acetyltransferase (GNAT) family protein [Aquimarina brevivitae]